MQLATHSQKREAPNSERGFTMIEIVVVLAVIALLAAVLSPMVVKYVRDARIAKAAADTKTIGVAIQQMENDLGRLPMFTSATNMREVDADVGLLVGPGAAPDVTTTGTEDWGIADGSSLTSTECGKGTGCKADSLDDQLMANTPSYPAAASAGVPQYWKGPYLSKLEADPWGNRYLVNIGSARSGTNETSRKAAFVISAGPDGKVQTLFANSRNSFVSPQGDDIIYRIR